MELGYSVEWNDGTPCLVASIWFSESETADRALAALKRGVPGLQAAVQKKQVYLWKDLTPILPKPPLNCDPKFASSTCFGIIALSLYGVELEIRRRWNPHISRPEERLSQHDAADGRVFHWYDRRPPVKGNSLPHLR